MKPFLQLLLSAVLITSCAAEYDGGTAEPDAIDYSVTASGVTRGGTPVEAESFATDGQQFRLWAWMYHDGETPVPVQTGFQTKPLSDVLVTYDGGSGAWTTADRFYWPQQSYQVDFCGIYPASARDHFQADDRTLTFTASAPVSGADDLMVAFTTDRRSQEALDRRTGETQRQAVQLHFSHMLAQVAFQGVLDETFQHKNWRVEVGSITLCNINGAGTIDCADGTVTPNTQSPALERYALTLLPDNAAGNNVAVTATAKPLTSLANLPMLLPQKRTAWDPAKEKSVSTTKDAYIAITCHMWDDTNHTDLAGSSSRFETVYAPLPVDWEPGRRYVYTIYFGAYYADDGNVAILPTVVSASINSWQTEGKETQYSANVKDTDN